MTLNFSDFTSTLNSIQTTFQDSFQSFSKSTSRFVSSREFQEKAPMYAVGLAAIGATIIIIGELSRSEGKIRLPPQPGTIIQAPSRELYNLNHLRGHLGGRIEEAHGKLTKQTEQAKRTYTKMSNAETFVAKLPSVLAGGVGSLVGANMGNVQHYNAVQHNLNQTTQATSKVQQELSNVDKQIELTYQLPHFEGALIDHRETISQAQQALKSQQGSMNDNWKKLNFVEKMTYFIPTHVLRRTVGFISRANFDKVSNCIDHSDVIARLTETINAHEYLIQENYKDIFATIHQKIDIAPDYQLQRVQTRDILETYKLAARLHIAANNAWVRIETYQRLDSEATSAEIAATLSWGCSEDEKFNLETEASHARSSADVAKYRATNQIDYVQDLSKQLDAQVKVIQKHLKTSIDSRSLQNPLNTAASRIHSFDLIEKLTGCNTWSIFHNIAELFNGFSIKEELDQIGKNANLIKYQLEDALVYAFTNERILHAEDNIVAHADALNNQKVKGLLKTYLDNWAEPGIWERI